LCERLLASFIPTDPQIEEVKLMLAESYIGEGKPWKAYEVLRECQSERNRYKLAFTCIKLKKMAEAERVLLSCRGKSDINNVPNGSAGLFLLAHS
jgi:anaphase-promoting complex subunit 3